MTTPLFLDEDQVRQHLRMSDLIPAMEKALIDFSDGKVVESGGKELALELEAKGYAEFDEAAA